MKRQRRTIAVHMVSAAMLAMLMTVIAGLRAPARADEGHAHASGTTTAPPHAETARAHDSADGSVSSGDPYSPYAFLIGEWDTPGGIRQSLRWGPRKSYIWYAVYVRPPGAAEEELHQEGLMTFNGKEKDLDFLFVHDPGSFNQEQGKVHVDADGSIVRETTAIYADGTVTHFRQTWRRTGASTATTSLLRQDKGGAWVPNFPGSDRMEMTKRAE